MKRFTILFLWLCLAIVATAQVPHYGARLVALIDLNGRLHDDYTVVRDSIVFQNGTIGIARLLERLPDVARILVLDYKTARVVNFFDYPRIYDFGFVPHKNYSDLLIYVATTSHANKKFPQDGVLYLKMPLQGGAATPIVREYFLSNRDLHDLSMTNYETAEASWPEGVSQTWPRDPASALFSGMGGYRDYTVYRKEVVILNEKNAGALDDSRSPYAAYTVGGEFLFRFPYTIAPLRTMGNYVQMVPETNQVLLYSHVILKDIYPEFEGTELGKQRQDFVFIYEFYRSDEWPESLVSSSQLIRINKDFTGIETAEHFDASRFNVSPGELPVHGLRGILSEDRVNLRSAPGLQGRVLLLMDINEHFYSNVNGGFIILERSQHQETIGGKTDYWYRVFWREPEVDVSTGQSNEGWVFGSFIKFFDPKFPFSEQ